MLGICQDHAELRVGDRTIPIGTATGPLLHEFAMPGLIHGLTSLRQDERYSPPRTLMVWNLPVKVNRGFSHGAQATIDWLAQTRALPATDVGCNSRCGTLVWQPAGKCFSSWWDPDGASVTWSVTGEATEGQTHYKHEGSGLRSVTFQNTAAWFSTADGVSAQVVLNAEFVPTYTTTATSLENGQTTVTQNNAILAVTFNASLGPDWTIQGGSSVNSAGDVITWPTVAPAPAVNLDEEAR